LIKKAKVIIFSFIFLVSFLLIEIFYLQVTKTASKDQIVLKKEFVGLTKLPDLAISTEATYIRHRSLSYVFDIYKDDGTIREYFPSSFVISAPQRLKN
jgi:hypothetical protein